MRDTIFIYMWNGNVMQARQSGTDAERFEKGLGDRLIGKVILEAR